MDQRLLGISGWKDLRLARVRPTSEPETRTNLKNNKAVAQTLVHPRYVGLSSVIPIPYQTALHNPFR
jgi:hypothetical protein